MNIKIAAYDNHLVLKGKSRVLKMDGLVGDA
jgi:hypothetical protein